MVSHTGVRGKLAAALAVLAAVAASVMLVACSALDEPEGAASPDPDAVMSAAPGGGTETISWSEAVDSVGQRLRVEGVVAGVKRVGDTTELSVGLPAPTAGRLVVVVPDKVAKRYDAPLRDLFDGMLVLATGTIAERGDHTVIRITRPGDLKPAQ